jgi:hypothetical protein
VAAIDGPVFRLHGPGVAGFADGVAGQAGCRISADYLDAPDALYAEILEPLVLYLVCRSDRVPVHASAVRFGELAVLLAGASGSGKSCLALAADSAGLAVMSDDTTYLQSRPRFRVWGWPGPAHVLPANAPVGIELRSRWRNGKIKYAVPLTSDAGVAALSVRKAVLCVLERGDRVALERLSSLDAMRRLEPLEPGFELMAEEIRCAHAALAAKGAWQLTLSRDPAEAIRLLSANLSRLAEAAAP